jgi:toxin ParE1/3/4
VRPLQRAHGWDALQVACEALAAGTRVGRPADMRPGVLKALVGAHMVYFRDRGGHLAVIRILHQRQDVSRNL